MIELGNLWPEGKDFINWVNHILIALGLEEDLAKIYNLYVVAKDTRILQHSNPTHLLLVKRCGDPLLIVSLLAYC